MLRRLSLEHWLSDCDGVRGRSFEETEEKREEYFCPLNILLPPLNFTGKFRSGNLKEFPIE